MNNGIWALVAVCSGLLLGELGGRLVRAAQGSKAPVQALVDR